MILNLSYYQADIPYPKVKNVIVDKKLAAKLREGYSGKQSELTTVLQYAYHSLMCKNKYNEISQVLRGIFYVESLHMEFLGECICKLGGNAHYMFKTRDQQRYWEASVVDYEPEPNKILLADIKGEKGAVEYYEKTAALTNQPEIAKLLKRLAIDERLHVKLFTDLYQKYRKK